MSFGDGNLHEQVDELKGKNAHLEEVNGELCAEINRQERRIRQLEQLVRDMYGEWCGTVDDYYSWATAGYYVSMAELGIEVG